MINDALMTFMEDEAITTATTYNDDTIDLVETNPNKGAGASIVAEAIVTETFAGGTSAVLLLEDSANNSSFAEIGRSAVIVTANLVAGKKFNVKLPDTHRRYLRASITSVGTHTAGAFSVYLRYQPM
jgi:hypothetical protein